MNGTLMLWLTELVWVGNTLYPRWFVFGVALIAIGTILVIAGVAVAALRS